MVEFWTEKYPDYVKKIYDAGHEIGTHSAPHP
ncbi:MAG: polysaccharide deacetylase family protein, partial [Clostridia bacterium]|nr:polysaccharide deacetylase family protein [Clostridia bacterium]